MNDATKEAEQLFPQGKTITLKGKEVTIKPFGFGKFPRLLKLLKDFKTDSSTPASAQDLAAMKGLDIAAFISDNSEMVISLCSLALGEKETFFDDLPPDEGITLCQAIIEVNADFFITRLQPKLLEALSGLTASVGGLSSQNLSQPATT